MSRCCLFHCLFLNGGEHTLGVESLTGSCFSSHLLFLLAWNHAGTTAVAGFRYELGLSQNTHWTASQLQLLTLFSSKREILYVWLWGSWITFILVHVTKLSNFRSIWFYTFCTSIAIPIVFDDKDLLNHLHL